MPRWTSRLLLEVVSVRVERLQAITQADAIAEGARRFDDIPTNHPYPASAARWSMESPINTDECLGTARHAFANFINKLHGGPRWNLRDEAPLWDQNPWVWVIEFSKYEATP